jgi:hypothetical protein
VKKVLLFAVSLCLAAVSPLAILSAQAHPVVQRTLVQYYGQPVYECHADNGYASFGVGQASSPAEACHLAKLYCAQNAPYGTVCFAKSVFRIN